MAKKVKKEKYTDDLTPAPAQIEVKGRGQGNLITDSDVLRRMPPARIGKAWYRFL